MTPNDTGQAYNGLGTDAQNFGAGAGKATVDTGRGLAQAALAIPALIARNTPDYAKKYLPDALNADSYYQGLKRDQAEANARDAALTSTKAGLAGDIAGNIGLGLIGGGASKAAGIAGSIVPSTYRGAALTGGLLGSVQPLAGDQGEGSRLLNTGVGAAGGVVGQGIANTAGATIRAGKGILAPFFNGGQDQIVANTLSRFGGDAAARATPSVVPGVTADLAEQTGSAGISQLRRAVQDKEPSIAELFTDQQAQNNAARLGLLRQVSGTPEDVAAALAARDTVAQAKYGQAFQDAASQ